MTHLANWIDACHVIHCPDRAAWLQQRTLGIGGSDAAVVAEVSTYKSLFALYQEKIGAVDVNDEEDERLQWGRILERPVRVETSRRLFGVAHAIQYPGRHVIYVHRERPWMRTSLDGWMLEPSDHVRELFRTHGLPNPVGGGLFEAKTSNSYMGRHWRQSAADDADEPSWPLDYQVQTQHAMEVLGVQWGIVACLVANERLVILPFVRNDRFIETLVAKEARFWECVQRRDAPTPDGHPSTTACLKRLYPDDDGEEIASDDAQLVVVSKEYLQAVEDRQRSEKREATHKNRLIAAAGSARYLRLLDGSLYSYKRTKAGSRILRKVE